MDVAWSFDDAADSEWDPYTLLGAIRITDAYGGFIEDNCIILDTWVRALHSCLRAARSGVDELELDLVDEPDPLCMFIDCGATRLRYRWQSIVVDDIEDAMGVVRRMARDLMAAILAHPPPYDELGLAELREVGADTER